MPVVSNTSPLSNLAMINRLNLLREQMGTLVIPEAVRDELDRHPDSDAKSRLDTAMNDGWIEMRALATPVPQQMLRELDAGEAEALALGLELNAELVLVDESAARRKAAELGLEFTGILGVLRDAKLNGRIDSLTEEIRRLRTEARFFIHQELEIRLLASVGEH